MTPQEFASKIEAGHKYFARCNLEGRALLQRAAIPTGPDGYPRRASGADPTVPSEAPTSLQDGSEGGRAISYSDPTGDCVTGPQSADPVRADFRRFAKRLDKALDELAAAAAVLDYQKHILGQATLTGDEDRWCQSCARDAGYREPVWAGRYAKLCRFCAEFYVANRVEPPMPILEARHAGRTIYDADVKRALAAKGRKAG